MSDYNAEMLVDEMEDGIIVVRKDLVTKFEILIDKLETAESRVDDLEKEVADLEDELVKAND